MAAAPESAPAWWHGVSALSRMGRMMAVSTAVIGGTILALRGLRTLLYARRIRTCRVSGDCPEHYAPLIAAILRNVGEGRDVGSQVAVTKGGELIVNVAVDCGGGAQAVTTDSLMCVFSSGKVIESLVMTLFDSRGWLRLSDRVSSVWPEFAAGGSGAGDPLFDKANVRVSDIMAHRAGLSMVDKMSLAEVKVRGDRSMGRALRAPPPPQSLWGGRLSDRAAVARTQDFHLPLSPGAARLRENLERTPRRYSGPASGARGSPETCYMATTRGLYLSVLTSLCDPKRRCFNDLVVEEIVKATPRPAGEPAPEVYCPLPAAMDDRVVPKRSNPYIPGFVRALVQALVPRRTYPCGHSASRARRSGAGRLTD